MSKQVLLVMNFNPDLEEDMVDYLLGLVVVAGFTSYPVRGHGENENLTVAEQVTGQRRRLQTELLLEQENVDLVLAGLKEAVGRDIVWWLQPVLKSGRTD